MRGAAGFEERQPHTGGSQRSDGIANAFSERGLLGGAYPEPEQLHDHDHGVLCAALARPACLIFAGAVL